MPKIARYEQNMKYAGLSAEHQKKLINTSVLVMGAGGLGSGVIMNLAALGVGFIKIIDDGIVQEKGLNRQLIHKCKNIGRAKVISAKDWIQEYNPEIKVEIEKIKLNELNYFNAIQGYDIIVDCFDSYEAKYMLNEISVRHKIPLIHAGIQATRGQVTTIYPPKTGCLECVMQKPALFKEQNYATLSPVCSVISSLQAMEVLKLATGTGEPLLNRLLSYDALTAEFKIIEFSKNQYCNCCSVEY